MTAAWQLRLADLHCRIEWRDDDIFWQLTHPQSPGGRTHSAPVGNVTVGNQSVRWTDLVDVAEGVNTAGAPALTLTLADASGRLRLVRHFELFAGHAFVRTWGEVQLVGEDDDADHALPAIDGATIIHLAVDAVTQKGEPLILFHVEQFSWPYHKDFFSPRQLPLVPNLVPYELRMGSFPAHYHAPSSCAWAALRAGLPDLGHGAPEGIPNTGAGLVIGIEFNGKSRLHAWATASAANLQSTIDYLAHTLRAGEPFEIPACFVGFYQGDWDEAAYRTQRFAEAYVHPSMPDDRYPWVQYNSWAYGQEIDEAQQLAMLERCAELGLEVAILDLGWARAIGDWRPDPVKFPRGLRPIADRAHELGIKFGVHVAIAQLAPDAPAALAHPEWLAFTGNDYYGAGAICLGHKPCRDWLIDSLVTLVEQEHLDYIIQDGEDVVKRCTRTDHTHSPGDSNYANSTMGLDQVILAVRQAHPHLVWENCEDGGCMMTYRMARLAHTSITVDNIATYATRQGVYGASYPFSARYSVRYMQDAPTPYTLRSSIFGGPLILMHRIGDWDTQQMADTKAAIEQYKHLRTIIRNAKIVHLLPPCSNVEGLGRSWDAIQAVSLDQRRSAVMVYRAVGGPSQHAIRPRCLAAGASYTVRFADSGYEAVHRSADLTETGVLVTLGELSSEVIELELKEE